MQCLTSGKRRGVSTRSRQRDQLASDGTRGVAAEICDGCCHLLSLDVAGALTHRLHVGRGANRGRRKRICANSIHAFRLRYRPHERDDTALRRGVGGDCRDIRPRQRSLGGEVDDRSTSSAEKWKKCAGHDIGGREIDRDHAMPCLDIAFRE